MLVNTETDVLKTFRHAYSSLFLREWGKYFPIITSNESIAIKDRFKCTKDLQLVRLLNGEAAIISSANPFKFINLLVYLTDYEQMSLLVELSFLKNYSRF